MSDNMFWHGIQRVIQSRVSAAQSKTFFYRFDCNTELNFVKKAVKAEAFEGTSHGEDLAHVWKHNGGFDVPHPRIDSVEMKMVLTMVSVGLEKCSIKISNSASSQVDILATFAITGDPNCPTISEATWEPVTSPNHPLPCLKISESEVKMIPLPETERLRVWDSLYDGEGVALY